MRRAICLLTLFTGGGNNISFPPARAREKLIELCVAVIKTSRLKSNTAASLAAHIFIRALIWHRRAALWILNEPTRQLAESVCCRHSWLGSFRAQPRHLRCETAPYLTGNSVILAFANEQKAQKRRDSHGFQAAPRCAVSKFSVQKKIQLFNGARVHYGARLRKTANCESPAPC